MSDKEGRHTPVLLTGIDKVVKGNNNLQKGYVRTVLWIVLNLRNQNLRTWIFQILSKIVSAAWNSVYHLLRPCEYWFHRNHWHGMLVPQEEARKCKKWEKIVESSVLSFHSDNKISGLGFGRASLECHNYDKLPLGVPLSSNTRI